MKYAEKQKFGFKKIGSTTICLDFPAVVMNTILLVLKEPNNLNNFHFFSKH